MKKLKKAIVLGLLLFGILPVSNGQLSCGFGIGGSTSGKIVYNLSANYQISRISITGELRPSLTRNVQTNNYEGIKAGFDVFKAANAELFGRNLFIEAGYYFDNISADKKQLNHYTFGTGLKYIKTITQTGQIFAEPFFINRSLQLTVGIIVKFI